MFLVDTNIWLERLLNQERSTEVAELLSEVPSTYLFITDFSLHSIGVIAFKLNCIEIFRKFVQDIFIEGSVGLTTVNPSDMIDLIDAMKIFNLDFDDAYQYSVMKKYDLFLISFDHDFDKIPEGRLIPKTALSVYRTRIKDALKNDG